MNPSQQAAFEAAAGSGMSPAVLNLLCIGALLAVLFLWACLLYTSPSPRDYNTSRMPSSA